MIKYVEMDSVLDEVYLLIQDVYDVGKQQVKTIGQKVVKDLLPIDVYDCKIKQFKIRENQLCLPDEVDKIIQVAVRDLTKRKVKRTEIVNWTQQTFDGTGCKLDISLECPNCHTTECSCDSPEVILDIDDMWRRANPQYQYGHMSWMYSWGGLDNMSRPISSYHPQFTIARCASSEWFNADFHVVGCLNLDKALCVESPVEYKIEHPYLSFNIEEGDVLVSYLTKRRDKEGFLMIPDNEKVLEAITEKCVEVLARRAWLKGMADQKVKYKDAQANYKRAYIQAYTELKTPSFNCWWDFLRENYFKMIKDMKTAGYYQRKTPDYFEDTLQRLTKHE